MTKVFVLCGAAFFAACVICGCRQEFDYSPPKGNQAGNSKSSGNKNENSGGVDKSTGKNEAVDKAVVAQELSPSSAVDVIAFDEFDGVNRGGWKQPGLGEWKAAAEERDGALIVAGDVDLFRALAQPVRDGMVWYAVTMHMAEPLTGFVTLTPSADGKTQFLKMGFSALEKPFTSRGFWVHSERETPTENTEQQTFLTRINFDIHRVEGYPGPGDGSSLLDENGIVSSVPRLSAGEGKLSAGSLGYFRLHKKGPEKLVIDRIAVARSAGGAILPQTAVRAPRPNDAAATETRTPANAAPQNAAK